ncbi:TetR/AcrR family transcriptional regulator [Amycolatopsis acidicola]|uniref:TetR/AcrR family transcriptional regulator n=1 Tax=Amycolatopsis acidicola TaxID=2596893 RepID=UPI00140A4886|nr:TetR/AcrR family transcriptional regulator [Amycolatopsis acidicola]
MPGRRNALPSDPGAAAESLLKTAEACFERYGVSRVTMDEIAVTAGVSRPTLYRYLGDREKLLRDIVERRAANLVTKVHRVIAKHTTLTEKLVTGTLFLVDIGRSDEFIRELLRSDRASFSSELMTEHGQSTDFAAAVWSPTLKSALDQGLLPAGFDEQMAYRWLTSINYMMLLWADYDDLSTTYKKKMLRGFLAPAFQK